MKIKLLFVCLLLSSGYCNGQYNWRALPNAPKSWRCDDFFFINPNVGWATNPNYSYSGGSGQPQQGRIFKTVDGGENWTLLKDSAGVFYRSIGFADLNTGWVGNLGGGGSADTNILFQTNDGGVNWAPANVPYPHPIGICGISVVNDSVVYAYGTFYGPAGYLKTTNKGATWVYKDMSAYASGLVDGYFFNKDSGFITGKGNDLKALILYTNDGGATWNESYHSTRIDTDIVWKLSFPGGNIAYASIEFLERRLPLMPFNTYFLKSNNRGATWAEHPFIPDYDEEGIGFINDSVGWIGGDNIKPTYKTTDGGNTWNADLGFGVLTPPYHDYKNYYLPGFAINRFRRFGDTLMYACGNTVYKLNTRTTGIASFQKEIENVGNYPNPFNEQTTITYNLPESSERVMLEVFGVMSGVAFSKDIGVQSKGEHKYIFDKHLPAGLYYYSISSGDFKSTQKMIIIH